MCVCRHSYFRDNLLVTGFHKQCLCADSCVHLRVRNVCKSTLLRSSLQSQAMLTTIETPLNPPARRVKRRRVPCDNEVDVFTFVQPWADLILDGVRGSSAVCICSLAGLRGCPRGNASLESSCVENVHVYVFMHAHVWTYVCVFVCTYVYVYARMYLCAYMYVCVGTCVGTYVCVYVGMYMFMSVQKCVCMYICMCACMGVCACACVYACVQMYLRAYICTYTHTVFACVCVQACAHVCTLNMLTCVCLRALVAAIHVPTHTHACVRQSGEDIGVEDKVGRPQRRQVRVCCRSRSRSLPLAAPCSLCITCELHNAQRFLVLLSSHTYTCVYVQR